MTVLHKSFVARAEGDDPLEYVMSDATVDRMGDIIDPKGWQLGNFKKNPVALFAHDSKLFIGQWKNVRVENGKLLGRLDLLAKGVSQRIDEIHAAVAAGILRAVSVGFRPLEFEPLPNSKVGGLRYTKSELMECSLVSVPANPNAVQVARSLNLSAETRALIFAKPGDRASSGERSPGEPAVRSHHIINRKGLAMPTLSEKIEAAQSRLVAMKDQLNDIVSKSDDLDETDAAQVDELSTRIEAQERSLNALKAAEQQLAVRSAATPDAAAPAIVGRRPLSIPAKQIKPRDHIVRAATVSFLHHVTRRSYEEILRERYADDEGTGILVKAAVAPATTTTSGWAAELVNTAMGDFIESLTPVSIYPRLAALGNRFSFDRNGAIKLPGRASTPSIGASFVGEGAPIPVRRFGLSSITLTPTKMGVISAFTREIAQYSTPAIEGLIRQAIQEDTAEALDAALLDATAGSATRPAGLRNGVSAITATAGGGHEAMVADLKALVAAVTANRGGRRLVWLMNPAETLSLSMSENAGGDTPFAAQIAAGTLLRAPIIESISIPAGTVILIDAADFVSATGDVPEFDVSDQATIHMEDTSPAAIGTAGSPAVVAAPVRSLFQTASIAVRMLLDVNWAMRRPGMIAFVEDVTW